MGNEKKYILPEETLPSIVEEPLPDYEKAEMDLLRAALKRNYKERFLIMTDLMKDHKRMKKAKITYRQFPK